jgi:uncharacterized protein
MPECEQVEIAKRLYDGMAARDAHAIHDALAEDFVGEVSDGMPLGVGGRHQGRDRMIADVWGAVFQAYDVRVDVDRYLACGTDEVVAVGRYRGTERATGHPVDAAFAHVLRVDDGHITSLQQITDTRRWVAGL